MGTNDATTAWLLEDDQPSVRARALTDLLGRPESDRDVRARPGRDPDEGVGRRDPRRAGPRGVVGRREAALPPEVPLHPLATPRPRRPRHHARPPGGPRLVRAVVRAGVQGRWRVRTGRQRSEPPLHDRQRGPRAGPVRVRGRPPGSPRGRLARDRRRPERGLVVLRVRSGARRLRAADRVRRLPPVEVDDRGHGHRRAGSGVLPLEGAPRPGGTGTSRGSGPTIPSTTTTTCSLGSTPSRLSATGPTRGPTSRSRGWSRAVGAMAGGPSTPSTRTSRTEWPRGTRNTPRTGRPPGRWNSPGHPSKLVTLTARRVLARVERARGGPFQAPRTSLGTPRAATRGSTAAARRPARRPARTR